jgi:competence protein ComFC
MDGKKLFKRLKDAKRFVLDIFFPKFCLNCGKEGRYICSECQVFVSEALPVCPVCGQPSAQGKTHIQCRQKYSLDGLTALWDYEGLVKKMIYQAKTGKYFDVFSENIKSFFEAMVLDPDRFSSFLSFLKSDHACIIYVPMLKKEKRKRGFNQAEIIAREISQFVNIETISLLEKTRETENQAALSKEERIENVKRAYVLRKDWSGIENVLLVDDTFISGATMKECAKVLKKAGIKKVWGFAIAKA